MQKEGDKVDNKTAYKEDRPREKRELERKIEVQILPCMHARKTTKKTCVITSDLAENIPFLLQNSCLALLMLISRNPVQTR